MQGKLLLGRYEVQRLLGEGGMGKVYLARQVDLQRQVVIKVMHERVAADLKFQERFQREMRMMARFQHPYAVALYDAAPDTPDGPCLVMEYVRGETLADILARNRRISPVRIGRILGQLCEVLQAAHQQGILHRDLKPSNLMIIDADTPVEKIKVMDFGLAKLVESPSYRKIADSGSEYMIGTPSYMCPEQIRGEEVDHRGDIYSVGVILYELLTGHPPYRGLSTMDLLLAHAHEPPPDMALEQVYIPPAIQKVVQMCLAKNPDHRPPNAWELARIYEEALLEESPADPQPSTTASSAGPQEPSQGLQAPPVPNLSDPMAVVFQMQAWMPETIATYKLRGFIQDSGGEVVENVPGRIRVRMGAKGTTYSLPAGRLAWFGLGGGPSIEMELQLVQAATRQQNQLWVTTILRYLGRNPPREWRSRCEQICRDLRGYLIGSTPHTVKQ